MAASTSNPLIHQVRWEYLRVHMQGKTFKLILTGKEPLIRLIKMRLENYDGVDAYEALKKNSLGHYLRYPEQISKSNRAIHYLVSRVAIAKPDPDPNAIFYKVNGEMVIFGRMEFALVTELQFGSRNFDPYEQNIIPANSVYTWLFDNNPISPLSLWYWFRDNANFKDLDYADCLKVSQVLIAAHIILGLDAKSSKIPNFVRVLIKKQKDWDRFPWGSLSFQILVKALRGVKKHQPSNSYHLIGNTLAFLMWEDQLAEGFV